MGGERATIRDGAVKAWHRLRGSAGALSAKVGRHPRLLPSVGQRAEPAAETVMAGGRRVMDETIDRGRQARSLVSRHPIGLAIGALAGGLLVGVLVMALRKAAR